MNTLSACLIVKNEEKNLRECLHALTDIVDEIIIVDTGSTDKTIEIANEYGAIIIQSQWEYNFSKARNIALRQASSDWILSIDADEVLLNPHEVLKTIQNAQSTVGGFLLSVQSYFDRADGGKDVFTTNLLRLFRNNDAIYFKGIIHEQVLQTIFSAGLEVAYSEIQFLHKGYNLSPNEMKKKQERNLQLLSFALEKKPHNSYNLMQRGKTYMALGDNTKAEADLRLSLEHATTDSIVIPQSLNYLGIVLFQRKQVREAIECANRSLSILPKQGFAQFILGESYSETKEYTEALRAYKAFEASIETPDPLSSVAGEYAIPLEQLWFRFGRTYIQLGNLKEAEISFKKGISFNKKEVGCLVGLADVSLKLGKKELAIQFLEFAKKLFPDRIDIQTFLDTAKSFNI